MPIKRRSRKILLPTRKVVVQKAERLHPGEYHLLVQFTRNFDADRDVLRAENKRPTVAALVAQFCRELQEAYDSEDQSIAGAFRVVEATFEALT